MQKKHNAVFGFIIMLALAAAACSLPGIAAPTPGNASIGGKISADLNGNGATDGEGGPLENVIVSLSGCGENKTALSDADGLFQFSGLPGGVCILEVTKGGWTYSASYPTPGYPIPVATEVEQSVSLVIIMRPLEQGGQTDQPEPTPTSNEPTATLTITDIPHTATPAFTATPAASPTTTTPMVSAGDKGVNCRFGPGIGYQAIDVLLAGQTVPILGRTEDSRWWQVEGPNYGSANCFLAASATRTTGDLSGIPVVEIPIPKGAPVILSVDLTKDRSDGSLVIYQEFHFIDTEGDVNYADIKLVSTTATHELNISGGSVDIPSAKQKVGASAPGKWSCGDKTYTVTLSITLLDKAGHNSEPYPFTMVCD